MKNSYRKINRRSLSLGEFLEAINSCVNDKREAMAAVADMFASGRVQIMKKGRLCRVKLGMAKS